VSAASGVGGASAAGPTRLRVEVAVGGAVGTLLRVATVAAVVALAPGAAVLGVLAANLVGAFLLGLLTARAGIDARAARWLSPIGGGLLGGLTTFSTLASDLALRTGGGEVGAAVALAVVSVLGGLLAAAAGLATGGRGGRRTHPHGSPS
jgi:fluoride exporter